jgi:hypothetical protein
MLLAAGTWLPLVNGGSMGIVNCLPAGGVVGRRSIHLLTPTPAEFATLTLFNAPIRFFEADFKASFS